MGVSTLDPFKDLGKCFFIPPSDMRGFIRGTNFQSKTQIFSEEGFYKEKEAKVYKIYLGIDRKKQLNTDLMPKGTEAIYIYNLKDGRQVINYLHYAWGYENPNNPNSLKIDLKTFCNEFRTEEVRLEPKNFFRKRNLD